MSKFNVGDLVRIVGPEHEKDWFCSPGYYPETMGYELGTVGSVKHISPSGNLYINGWYWSPDWVEPVSQSETFKCEITGLDCDPGCEQCTLGDPVNPEHYHMSDIEPIDAIEAWELGFCLGNVVKYVARHAHKGNPLGDLKKAAWYLDRAIKEMEK